MFWPDPKDMLVHTAYARAFVHHRYFEDESELREVMYAALETPYSVAPYTSFARRDVQQRTWSVDDLLHNEGVVHQKVVDVRKDSCP
jgi:hypothetical protein